MKLIDDGVRTKTIHSTREISPAPHKGFRGLTSTSDVGCRVRIDSAVSCRNKALVMAQVRESEGIREVLEQNVANRTLKTAEAGRATSYRRVMSVIRPIFCHDGLCCPLTISLQMAVWVGLR